MVPYESEEKRGRKNGDAERQIVQTEGRSTFICRDEIGHKRLLDALVDLPFALPTAVAGLVYAHLYGANGWFGQWLVPMGIHGSNSKLGIVLVLTFIGLPFAVSRPFSMLKGSR